MSRSVFEIPLAGASPGTRRVLKVRRYGEPGARPKAYIQAGLHAEEVPGMLVAHHLCRRLDEAAAEGRVRGEILVLPVANPVGLDQVIDERLLGRFDLAGGGNFNRHYPDLAEPLAEALRGRLTDDAGENVVRIRSAMAGLVHDRRAVGAADALRTALLGLAITADIVLDLHCDDEALAHLYLGTPLWPEAEDLPRDLGTQLVLLAETSGGEPFDEACSTPWWRLRALLGGAAPIPAACLAATVELRGMTDVDDALAAADAERLIAVLTRRGALAGNPPPLPPWRGTALPLAGVDMVAAPSAGIVCHRAAVGARVRKGQVVAELVDPSVEDPAAARMPLFAGCDGLLFGRIQQRFARAGDVIAKIAGADPLPGKGTHLLTGV
jgi:hypothetical protein